MKSKIQALREQRANAAREMQALVNSNTGTAWNSECQAKFENITAGIESIDAEIYRIQKVMDAEAGAQSFTEALAQQRGISQDQAEDERVSSMRAFGNFLRVGIANMTAEDRAVMQRNAVQINAAQGVGTGSAGGYTVPQEFMRQLEVAIKAYGGMRDVATVIQTASGADMPFPTSNDTGNAGAILAENAQITGQDVAFGVVTLKSYMYTSKLLLVSYQMMQDTAFDLEAWLAMRMGERLARAENAHFTTGTGSGQPNGVVTAAVSGKVGTTGQTTSIIYDDLVDLLHSVDPAYRKTSKFMLADSTLKVIKKLKDTTGRPLWSAGVSAADPDTILGYQYSINQDMPAMAANAKSVLFGDFSKYYIRDTQGAMIRRLDERYADYLQVGFFGFQRTDGNLIDAGTNPIKYYQNSAT